MVSGSSKCYAPERLSKLVQSADYMDRVMGVLMNSCNALFQHANISASLLPLKETLPCAEKIEVLRPSMRALGELARPCIPYRKLEEVPLEDRMNIIAPSSRPLSNELIMGTAELELPPAATSGDCKSMCTSSALSTCTVQCSYAIYYCTYFPYTSTCLNYAYECFYDVPVCCDCAAYYGLCSCSTCGY